MKCPACDYEASQEDFGEQLCCPSCGAFYAKALSAQLRREGHSEEVSRRPKAVGLKKNWMRRLAIASCLVAASYLVAAPYLVVYQIRQAVKARDADALERHIDFPRVRESLKEQINAKMMADTATELKDNPFAALGMAFAGALVDRIVAAYVTPAGLAEMMKGEKPDVVKSTPPSARTSKPSSETEREPLADAEMGYEGFSRFVVTIVSKADEAPVRFVLTRSGFSWQVSDVKLPL